MHGGKTPVRRKARHQLIDRALVRAFRQAMQALQRGRQGAVAHRRGIGETAAEPLGNPSISSFPFATLSAAPIR